MATLRLSFTAGALIRGTIRRDLQEYAFDNCYDIDIKEDKGLLDSLFMVKLSVPDNKARLVYGAVKSWMNSMDNEEDI